MKITFTPDTPLTPYEPGRITLEAQTPEEVKKLGKELRLDLEELAPAFLAGHLTRELPWRYFHAEGNYLDPEFLEPYFAALEKLTGSPSRLRSEVMEFRSPGVYKGEYIRRLWIQNGRLYFDLYARDWHKPEEKDEEFRFNYAHRAAEENMKELLGVRPAVPQYIQAGNNAMVPNPKWGTGFRHPVKPGLHNMDLWRAMFAWWLENQASDRQRAAVAACSKGNTFLSYGGYYEAGWHPESQLYILDAKGTIPWKDGKNAALYPDFSESSLSTWTPYV